MIDSLIEDNYNQIILYIKIDILTIVDEKSRWE